MVGGVVWGGDQSIWNIEIDRNGDNNKKEKQINSNATAIYSVCLFRV